MGNINFVRVSEDMLNPHFPSEIPSLGNYQAIKSGNWKRIQVVIQSANKCGSLWTLSIQIKSGCTTFLPLMRWTHVFVDGRVAFTAGSLIYKALNFYSELFFFLSLKVTVIFPYSYHKKDHHNYTKHLHRTRPKVWIMGWRLTEWVAASSSLSSLHPSSIILVGWVEPLLAVIACGLHLKFIGSRKLGSWCPCNLPLLHFVPQWFLLVTVREVYCPAAAV